MQSRLNNTLLAIAMLALTACANLPSKTNSPKQAQQQMQNLNGSCDQKQNYNLNFARFDETAEQIAHATHCFIQTDTSKTGSIKPNPVQGYYSPREAIAIAIKGTALKITSQQKDVIAINVAP